VGALNETGGRDFYSLRKQKLPRGFRGITRINSVKTQILIYIDKREWVAGKFDFVGYHQIRN